jgi:pimeloyl-ACP methyl ester carboxylesterase
LIGSLQAKMALNIFEFVEINGLRVRFFDSGSGKLLSLPSSPPLLPLLLIHGLGGSIESWTKNIEDLAKRNLRVIALDLPGFGFSDKPQISYTIKFYVDFVAGFLKALRVGPVAVVGSSLGGHVACELAIAYPRIVSRLILLSPSGAPPRSFKGTPALRRYIRVLQANSVEEVKRAIYAVDHKSVDDAYAKATLTKFALPGTKEAFLSALEGSTKAPRLTSSRLSKVGAPTLVLWGKEDIMIPAKYVQPFVKMNNCRLILLEDCGHRPHADKPDIFNRIVADFVKEGEMDKKKQKRKSRKRQ